MKNEYKMLVRKPEGKRPLKDLGVYGKIILEWILVKWGGNLWTGFSDGSIDSNRTSGPITGREFLDYLNKCKVKVKVKMPLCFN
jgi:hypothetical protein